MRKRGPAIMERLMAELIMLGGEVVTRQEAMERLQAEGVPRGAIDRCVFGVKQLTEEEVLQFVRNGLILTLRCQCLAEEREEQR